MFSESLLKEIKGLEKETKKNMFKIVMGACGSGKSIALLGNAVRNPGKRYAYISNEEPAKHVIEKFIHFFSKKISIDRDNLVAFDFSYDSYKELEKFIKSRKDEFDVFLVDVYCAGLNQTEVIFKLKELSKTLEKEIVTTIQFSRLAYNPDYNIEEEVFNLKKRLGVQSIEVTQKVEPKIPFLSKRSWLYRKIVKFFKLKSHILIKNFGTQESYKVVLQ